MTTVLYEANPNLTGAANIGLDPSDCIVIEDSRSGIMSAHNAHIGKIIGLGPIEKHPALSRMEGVIQTIVDFNDILRDTDSLWR